MKLKTGKDEIVYLLEKVFERYERETGEPVVRNTNRKNYEGVARLLSTISNELPQTAENLQHDPYTVDHNPKNPDYPFRKYDITSSQIKDAYFGIVANPRPFLVDACYIYLYGKGRKGFEQDPDDERLLLGATNEAANSPEALAAENQQLRSRIDILEQGHRNGEQVINTNGRSKRNVLIGALTAGLILFIGATLLLLAKEGKWARIKKEMNILPYAPTQTEIDSLAGIWLCYTGSPQARSSDTNRYHMVVSNVVDVRFKDGYFTFTRYGASFDHVGYMQFEAPWLVSIHSYVKNNSDSIESPRHSLMRLDKERGYVPVISASWNFDVGSKNKVIGIREVYMKQGKGSIEEVINTIENASCHCKIIRWHQSDSSVKTFYLRNEPLERIADTSLKRLLDEKSILLRTPDEKLVISDTVKNNEQVTRNDKGKF